MYQQFIQYFQRYLSETPHLEHKVQDLWLHCQKKDNGSPIIDFKTQATPPYAWSLSIVLEDRPFIVESVLENLHTFGLNYNTLLHPIIKVKRDLTGQLIDVAAPHEERADFHKESTIYLSGLQFKGEQKELIAALNNTLSFLILAVDDWQKMAEQLERVMIAERSSPLDIEVRAFLEWAKDDHFTFMGYGFQPQSCHPFKENLGFLSHPAYHHLISTVQLNTHEILRVHKSTTLSLIRRHEPMDIITVVDPIRPDAHHHFFGLWTTYALQKSPRQIPFLRQKIEKAAASSQLVSPSYAYKQFLKVMESWPRDVLFETYTRDLLAFAQPFLEHTAPHTLKVYFYPLRETSLMACLIYIKSSFFKAGLVSTIVKHVLTATNMQNLQQEVDWTNFGYVRLYLLLQANAPMCISSEMLEAQLKEYVIPWNERLRHLMMQSPDLASACLEWFDHSVFPEHYQEGFSPEQTLEDLPFILQVLKQREPKFRIINPLSEMDTTYRIMMYHYSSPIPLSDFVPILENVHFFVLTENAVPIRIKEETIWIHWVEARLKDNPEQRLTAYHHQHIVQILEQVYQGAVLNEPINRLVVKANLSLRECFLIRSVSGYVRQSQQIHSQAYLQEILLKHPVLVQCWINAFHVKFDPQFHRDRQTVYQDYLRTAHQLITQLYQRDEEEVWLTFFDTLDLMVRTNFYQIDETGLSKPWISFKLSHVQNNNVPLDGIYYEIFVFHRTVQAVHLRGGKIARGGIRWSDRKEDFRKEVFDLVTAQMLKNAIIVPTGSKGGFVLRETLNDESYEAWNARGLAGYQIMIEGLLDLTDNLQNNEVLTPDLTICHDTPDPYLVVAADKGTATFSDYANQIAIRRNFWLGDAFASGGSVGYDHKKLGITSRRAWESTKRHSHHLGLNPEKDPIRVIAIGDMSGDVFGNGMLQSKTIELVGAFNHKHIFIDPHPNPQSSYEERLRLFNLPRSQWSDYNTALISTGGGIFERSVREIELTPFMQKLLHVTHKTLEPHEFIKVLLKAPVDLIWFGGIGTYIKAKAEEEEQVSDKANKLLRVNGEDIRARIIVEGANLGVTHHGRIAYAKKGGRINTDTIDNSGGVDCSDHEVNIKILCQWLIQQGQMTLKERNSLLEEMTDNVAQLVLTDNFQHNQMLSFAQEECRYHPETYIQLLNTLKDAKRISRKSSKWPSDKAITEQGFLRPDLCVLVAYVKMWLKEVLLAYLPADLPSLKGLLQNYFPLLLRQRYEDSIQHHPLKREIAITMLVNECINRQGLCFVNAALKGDSSLLLEHVQNYLKVRDTLQLEAKYQELDQMSLQLPFEETYQHHQVLKNQIEAALNSA